MARQEYKMSFSTGGLFLNESLEVARLHLEREPWEQTILRALEEGTTSLPKSASKRRTLREISNRLLTLSDEERTYLIEEADRSDQQALLWLAICRAYRFIREFAVEVTGWKIVLDRGLDILQAPIRREGFSLGVGDRLQEHRMTKFFYVTYVREEKHA